MVFKDQLNRNIEFNSTPKRIVCLVPSLTELICDLGLENELLGITKFCVHPQNLMAKKTIVGGTKQVQIQKIKDLKPDIILCNKEENTQEIIVSLKPIAQVHISDINTLDECFELIEMYGNIFEVKEKAEHIKKAVETKRSSFRDYIKDMPTKRIAYFIWKDPWMITASSTFIDSMINEAGFQNCYSKLERYPQILLDDPALKEADEIFLSSEPYPFKVKHVEELQSKFPNTQIKIIDGEFFSWYGGSRLLKAFDYFKSLH